MPEIRYYIALDDRQPFAGWFEELESVARARVTRAIVRLEQGNFSNVKSVGEGVFEYRIDFGPGYRVYLAQDGQTLVILLTGGTKKRQQRDIEEAHAYWQDYKQSKRGRR
jgi:putative addiction module killer protein